MSTKTNNFRYRFENEAYCKAIEWLASNEVQETAQLGAPTCSEVESFYSGAVEAVAMMFDQGVNTVYEDFLFRRNHGAFRVCK